MFTAMSWRLERGASVGDDGAVTFSVWAPRRRSLTVRILDAGGGTRVELPMVRGTDGVFTAHAAPGITRPGDDYVYLLPDVGARPDPVSRHQPAGVHAPSRIVAPGGYVWNDAGWRGIARADLVFYELHVGTFSPEGTFAGVASRLPYLRDLGITAVELMPVAAFPGERNWGYDGVYLYAPHTAYGGPDELKRLSDACHAHGLALFLDVVYNHLGPEGNYLADFGPYFTNRYRTPWGDALNFDGADSDEVRRFFVDNAVYWLSEYHLDGLRLDAIQGIHDFSARPILQEIADAFHAEAARAGRQAWLVAESDLNDPRVIRPKQAGGLGMDAQWSDDFHHALHAVVSGNRRGYFGDFGRLADVKKAIESGFVYDGQHAPHRRRRHGASSAEEPGDRFVAFIQNHDQVANAYQGRRLGQVAGLARQRLAAAMLFSSPVLPMLFQGEEYGEQAPFDYFISHGDAALVEAVRHGRHAEYLHLLDDGADIGAWSDPQAEQTFRACKLRWPMIGTDGGGDRDTAPHAEMLAFYRALIALRRRLPALANGRKDMTHVDGDEAGRWLTIHRGDPSGAAAVTLANLGDAAGDVRLPPGRWRLALATAALPALEPGASADGGAAVALPPSSAAIFETAA